MTLCSIFFPFWVIFSWYKFLPLPEYGKGFFLLLSKSSFTFHHQRRKLRKMYFTPSYLENSSHRNEVGVCVQCPGLKSGEVKCCGVTPMGGWSPPLLLYYPSDFRQMPSLLWVFISSPIWWDHDSTDLKVSLWRSRATGSPSYSYSISTVEGRLLQRGWPNGLRILSDQFW